MGITGKSLLSIPGCVVFVYHSLGERSFKAFSKQSALLMEFLADRGANLLAETTRTSCVTASLFALVRNQRYGQKTHTLTLSLRSRRITAAERYAKTHALNRYPTYGTV